jgi:predicted TIM-barrel fold metal-dependent hydrolase
MRIIDAHVHLWAEPRPGYQHQDLEGFPFPREIDGTAETLIARLDANGVERAVVVHNPWWVHDERYLLEALEKHPSRLTGVGCLPLYLKDADLATAAHAVAKGPLQGLRIQFSGPGALAIGASDALDPLYRAASDRGVPLILLSRQFAAHALYERIARAFPDLRLVIEHFGHATPAFGATPADQDSLLALADRPNFHVKLAIHHQHSAQPYPWADVFDFQARLIGAFGANRCLWGSNWPMKLPDPTYEQRLGTVLHHFPFRSEEDKAWVLSRTADGLWPAAALQSIAAAE